MICPACRSPLRKAKTGQAIVDLCPNCRGIWFDEDEFLPTVRGLCAKIDSGADLAGLFKPRNVDLAGGESPRLCPRCSIVMHNFNYAYDSNVLLDRCPGCNGIWADRGEVHKVAAHLKGDPRTEEIGKYLVQREKDRQDASELHELTSGGTPLLLFVPRMLPIGDDEETKRFPLVTVILIQVCVACFVLSLQASSLSSVFETWGHKPADFFSLGLISSMFLHADFWHILGNMYFLWLFGDNIEDRLGRWLFPIFYVASGLAATIAHTLANPESTVPCIGASGAVSGVMGAYLIFYPTAKIKLLFYSAIIHVPAVLYLGGWFAMQVLYAMISGSSDFGGIAWFAHVGGFVFGAVFAFAFKRYQGCERIAMPE